MRLFFVIFKNSKKNKRLINMKILQGFIFFLAFYAGSIQAESRSMLALFTGLISSGLLVHDISSAFTKFRDEQKLECLLHNNKSQDAKVTEKSNKDDSVKKDIVDSKIQKSNSFLNFYFKRLFLGQQNRSIFGALGLLGSIFFTGLQSIDRQETQSTDQLKSLSEKEIYDKIKLISGLDPKYLPTYVPSSAEIDALRGSDDITEEGELAGAKLFLYSTYFEIFGRVNLKKTFKTRKVAHWKLDCVVHSIYDLLLCMKNVQTDVFVDDKKYDAFKAVALRAIADGPVDQRRRAAQLQGKWLGIQQIQSILNSTEVQNHIGLLAQDMQKILIMVNGDDGKKVLCRAAKNERVSSNEIFKNENAYLIHTSSNHATAFHIKKVQKELVLIGMDSAFDPPFEDVWNFITDPYYISYSDKVLRQDMGVEAIIDEIDNLLDK